MESKHSPDQRRAEDTAWAISAGTRQDAREADACMAFDDWLYEAPRPPSAGRPPAGKPRSGPPPPPPPPAPTH